MDDLHHQLPIGHVQCFIAVGLRHPQLEVFNSHPRRLLPIPVAPQSPHLPLNIFHQWDLPLSGEGFCIDWYDIPPVDYNLLRYHMIYCDAGGGWGRLVFALYHPLIRHHSFLLGRGGPMILGPSTLFLSLPLIAANLHSELTAFGGPYS